MGSMKDVTMNNDAEVLAVTTLGHVREQMPDLPADLKSTAESAIPSLAAIWAEFDGALKGTGVDPDAVTAEQDRFLNRLAELSAGVVKHLQERINGSLRFMTPPQQDARVLVEYRSQMREALNNDSSAVLSAYYDAAESQDDATMQAVEQAPKWDRLYALTADQRANARRMRWGDAAKAMEAMEELRFHVVTMTQTVKNHIKAVDVDELLDSRLSRR